ncbi:MAG: hypothetical protein WEA61_07360 [Anaerolineales bacterium]
MSEQKVVTKHPLGKTGRRIDKEKYEMLKRAILNTLRGKELTHTDLMDVLAQKLTGKFTDNIYWYAETVKLDLEARKIIERTTSKPQRYRIK